MFRRLLPGILLLMLFACTNTPVNNTRSVQIAGMMIENKTEMFVSAVRLLVPVTGNFVSCGNIPPGSMCATTFPEAAYSGNPVEVTWSQGGQIYSTGQFTLQLPADLDVERTARVSVVLTGAGSAGALIVQAPD